MGGYIFLRFITPFITAPFAHRLIDVKPSNVANRNLVLLAKAVQNVSNMVPFGKKESYMMPLNPLMTEISDKRENYFSLLTKIESREQHLGFSRLHQCASTAPPMIHITVKELVCLHDLLHQRYIQKIIVSTDSKPTPDDDEVTLETGYIQAVPIDSYTQERHDSMPHLTELLQELGDIPKALLGPDADDADIKLLCPDRWAREHTQGLYKEVWLMTIMLIITRLCYEEVLIFSWRY